MIKSTINNIDCQTEPLQQMRNYEVVSIRRKNRQQHFQKKRINTSLNTTDITTIPVNPILRAEEIYLEQFQPSDLEELIQNIESEQPHLWLRSAVGLRKLSCLDCDFGAKMLEQRYILRILALAQVQEYPQIMAEALWCLCNILSGQFLEEDDLIKTGIADVVINIIKRSSQFDSNIYIHTVIILGNIAIESQKIRDYFIYNQCIQFMVQNLCNNQAIQLEILNGTLWAFSNLLRSHTLPPYNQVQSAVRYISCVVAQGIQNLESNGLISDCLFVLSKYVNNRNGNLQEMKDRGLIPIIIKRAKDNADRSIVLSCLRVLGNFSTENWQQMLYMIQEGLVQLLQANLYNQSAIVRRESCWILSNMAPNPIQVAKHIYQNSKLLNKLKEMLQNDDVNVRKQICFIISNLCYCMLVDNFFKLAVVVQLAENMAALLYFGDDRIIEAVLRCLIMVLSYFCKQNETYLQAFLNHFERAQGYENLQKLQLTENQTICDMVNQIIRQFCEDKFDCGEVDKDAYNWNNVYFEQEDEKFYDGFEQFKQNNPL